MQEERIDLGPAGLLVIAPTPDEFPFGARGVRPLRFYLERDADINTFDELKIPGAILKSNRLDVAFDLAETVGDLIGCREQMTAMMQRRDRTQIPYPGMEHYQTLDLSTKRYDYQAESARFLFRRSYAILGEAPRTGKSNMLLITHALAGSPKTLIVLNALGRRVWAEEIALWLGQSAAMLYGRGGDEVRVFCVPCGGRGYVYVAPNAQGECEPVSCQECKAKNGQSLGEKLYLIRDLQLQLDSYELREEPTPRKLEIYYAKIENWRVKCSLKIRKRAEKETQRRSKWDAKRVKFLNRVSKSPRVDRADKIYVPLAPLKLLKEPIAPLGQRISVPYATLPPVYRCTQHPDETDSVPRPCRQCKKELLDALTNAKFVLCNYDCIMAQTDINDRGVVTVRTDLPGWAGIIASLPFEMGIISESHRCRGINQSAKAEDTRASRVYDMFAPIKRVYAETGTMVYTRLIDAFNQLQIVSKGLFS